MGRNEDLVKRVQEGETDVMGELWENNTGLVAFVAKRYQEGCGRLVDFDDLMQAGYLGLYAAAMTYSPERAAFSTYAVFHLRRAMRPVVGLRGKRDALFDACPLDAPLGDDGGDTLLDMIAAPPEEDLLELKDLQRIVREAVARIQDKKTREAIEAIYWEGIPWEDYAKREGITHAGAGVRLQHGYALLRRDPAIVSLALAEGYGADYFRYKGLAAFRASGSSAVEEAVVHQEYVEERQTALYRQLGGLVGVLGK